MQAYPPLPYKQIATHWVVFQLMLSGRQDSNLRLSGPKPDALTGLRYTPNDFAGAKVGKSPEKTKKRVCKPCKLFSYQISVAYCL